MLPLSKLTPIYAVMRHRAAASFHRQTRLGAIQRLDLAFLIDRQHHGVLGRIDVEPDDLVRFLGKARILRQL